MTRAEAVISAWNKISEYVRKEYAGVFQNGLRFRWKHDVYGWTEFGVTPKGDAFIATGMHGAGENYTEYYYRPDKSKTYEPKRIGVTSEVVEDWQKIKKILEKRAEKEKALYDFQV